MWRVIGAAAPVNTRELSHLQQYALHRDEWIPDLPLLLRSSASSTFTGYSRAKYPSSQKSLDF